MRSILKQSLKLFTMCMAVTIIFLLSQSAAQANELLVNGSTQGSTFDNVGPPTSTRATASPTISSTTYRR
jgi:hypothetical protein